MPKRPLRQEFLQRRAMLDKADALSAAVTIQQSFLALPVFVAARVVALYQAVRGEVPTDLILQQTLRAGKRAALPRVGRAGLEFVVVDESSELVPGAFGILEPADGEVLSLADIDLMALPGVAFDRRGQRLGYGKGYYDRYLHRVGAHCALVGLAYACQVAERLPAEAHDVHVDCLITETATLRFTHTPPEFGAHTKDRGGS